MLGCSQFRYLPIQWILCCPAAIFFPAATTQVPHHHPPPWRYQEEAVSFSFRQPPPDDGLPSPPPCSTQEWEPMPSGICDVHIPGGTSSAAKAIMVERVGWNVKKKKEMNGKQNGGRRDAVSVEEDSNVLFQCTSSCRDGGVCKWLLQRPSERDNVTSTPWISRMGQKLYSVFTLLQQKQRSRASQDPSIRHVTYGW